MGFYNRYFPLGLVSIATTLRQIGHAVKVYDADTNEAPSVMDYKQLDRYYAGYLDALHQLNHPVWVQMRQTIEAEDPDLIGISIWTTYAASAFRVAEISKTLRPNCPVVMGGPHATAKADEVMRICPAVDYVIRGEAEAGLAQLVTAIADPTGQLDDIEGLSFRQAGQIRHNRPRQTFQDLSRLPWPDLGLLINKDRYSAEDMGLVMTSRGCPFSCAFCATETKRVRYRPIEQVIEHILHVKDNYGTVQFSIKDDSFTVNKNRVAEFCDALISEKLGIKWECNTRVDLVTAEMLAHMKRAGCNSVKVGVESGSEDVLRRMNKGTTLDQIRQTAQWLRRAGIYWTAYFLIGTPGETPEDIYRTLDFMYEIKPDFASLGVYETFPGPPMFDEGVRRGLVKPDMTLEEFYTILPNDYYKADSRRQTDTMDQERFVTLESEMKTKFHRYNNSFPRLFKRARSRIRLYLSHPSDLWADFKKYRSWS